MVWAFLSAVLALVLFVGYRVAEGRLPYPTLPPPVGSTPDHGLPEQPAAADVDRVRFDSAFVGYDFAAADARLADLRARLVDQEHALAEFEGQPQTAVEQ